MYCSRRLYKGNDYEICLPLTDTGVTLVRFYTGKDVYVEKEPEISGDSMCFSLTKEDLESLTDGVIRYEVVTEYETTDTNSPYVLKTPENYDAKSLDEIIEELNNADVNNSFHSKIYNRLGSTVRGPFDGGEIEWNRFERFTNTAKRLRYLLHSLISSSVF